MSDHGNQRGRSHAGKPPSPPPAPPLPQPASTNLPRRPASVDEEHPSHPTHGISSKNLSGRKATMAARFAAVDRANASRREAADTEQLFTPCHIFFYGSLMDAQVLQTVASLGGPPAVQHALVRGLRTKMWGVYPTAIPDEQVVVAGTVWYTEAPSHLSHLQEYEKRADRMCDCEIELDGGQRILGAKIFCWAGEADSSELEEGWFDFERWQKNFKPSILSRLGT